jgi:hypothetical protein
VSLVFAIITWDEEMRVKLCFYLAIWSNDVQNRQDIVRGGDLVIPARGLVENQGK